MKATFWILLIRKTDGTERFFINETKQLCEKCLNNLMEYSFDFISESFIFVGSEIKPVITTAATISEIED